ncbi:MAG: hypothetical protein FJZ01_12635 [Candidatus Sericytochromatia bacterium]|nr:hypothetical protein [Candidatus Tanganyikabacteria bacterium]
MGLLDIVRRFDREAGRPADLAIVGTAKNVGKTTTLAWLLERLDDAPLGLTSVGRDGEDIDAVTDLPKPRVEPPAGTLVATSETSARRSRAQLALVRETSFRTALGPVGIYRASGLGPVEVSGPVTVDDAARVRELLHDLGAARVLVDGAIDRRASASARVADGVILATGMALLDSGGARLSARARAGQIVTEAPEVPGSEAERIAAVARRSAEILRMLALPGGGRRDAGAPGAGASAGAILPDGAFVPWTGPQVLDHADLLVEWLPPEAEALVLAGALTERVAQALMAVRGRRLDLVVPDGTHVLCSAEAFERLAARGVALRAASPIAVLAVTVNPTSPHAPGADPARLLAALREALTPVPTFDLIAAP